MSPSISILENFVKTRENLSDNMLKLINLGEAMKMPEEINILREFNQKLLDNIFRIIVIGEFKRGKSTFINAMLGGKILPVGITPTTATVNIVRYGETPAVTVKYKDHSEKQVSVEELNNYVTTKSKELEKIELVIINYPAKLCKENVEIVDSPGVNDIDEQRVEITYDYIPKCDAAIFLMNATQQFSSSEREFLSEKVNKYINKIFFLLNKVDQLEEHEQIEAMEYVKGEVGKLTENPKIFPVSAKFALQSRQDNDVEALKLSKLEEFETELFNFLLEEKGKAILQSPIQRSFNAIDKMNFSIEVKLKAYQLDLKEIEKRFEVAKIEFEKLELEKAEIVKTIDAKKSEILTMLATNIKLAVFEFQNQVETHIIKSSTTDMNILQQETIKYLENIIQLWGKKEEEMVSTEITKLMEYIEIKTRVIQQKIQEIQLNFIGDDSIKLKEGATEEKASFGSNYLLDMIPDFFTNKMGELSSVARGAIFIFGAALLTGGALIPAILLGSAASYITGTVLKDAYSKKHKKELISRFRASLETLPEKILENISQNVEAIFEESLKRQVINEIDSIIHSAQTTLSEITDLKRNKESETESTKLQLNNYKSELATIAGDLKTLSEAIA